MPFEGVFEFIGKLWGRRPRALVHTLRIFGAPEQLQENFSQWATARPGQFPDFEVLAITSMGFGPAFAADLASRLAISNTELKLPDRLAVAVAESLAVHSGLNINGGAVYAVSEGKLHALCFGGAAVGIFRPKEEARVFFHLDDNPQPTVCVSGFELEIGDRVAICAAGSPLDWISQVETKVPGNGIWLHVEQGRREKPLV